MSDLGERLFPCYRCYWGVRGPDGNRSGNTLRSGWQGRRACGAPAPWDDRGRQRRFPTSFFSGLQIWCAAQARAACWGSTDLSTGFHSVCIERSSCRNATQRGAVRCAEHPLGPRRATRGAGRLSGRPCWGRTRAGDDARRAPPLRILGAVAGGSNSGPCLVPTTPSRSYPPRELRP